MQIRAPWESAKAGYSYTIIAWAGLIPFILMFILPLVLYGGKINIRTVDGVYRLATGDLLDALFVFASWIVIAIAFAGAGIKLFPKTGDARYWSRTRLNRVFFYLSILGGGIFVVHQIVVFPPTLENLVHLASMAAYWALGLGLCLVFDPRQDVRGDFWGFSLFLTIVLFLVLTLLPIVLGKAAGVASAAVVVVVALYLIRARFATKMAAILFAGFLVAASMAMKTTLREVFYEGRVYQRIAWSSLINTLEAKRTDRAINRTMAQITDSLANDRNAFSSYDQNLGNIILPSEMLGGHLLYSVARIGHRLNHLGLLGHVIVSTPGMVPYWGGATYKPIFSVPIPRAVWPEKPRVEFANRFGRQYKLLMPDDGVTTVNIDPVTEAWMNGGWLAVLFSSAGIGLFFGGILGWLRSGGDQHVRFLAALTVVLNVALFESETALIIGGLIQGLLFLGAIVIGARLLVWWRRSLPPMRATRTS